MKKSVLILGAGVSGLSTGILFLQEGYSVTIWAKDFPPNTTSNKAAAVWYPFICGPLEKVPSWARTSLEYFESEILPIPESGCKRTTVVEIFNKVPDEPWWKEGVDSYRRIDKYKLPKHYIDGYQIEGLVMDTDVYMEYLVSEFKRLGGKMVKRTVKTVDEALERHPLVINCTGLGSRELCKDESVYPVRGQIVKIKPNGFDYSLFEEEGPNSLAYIIPRLRDIVLGGTAQKDNWNLEPDPKDTKEILQKCANILPQFKKVDILEVKVGLRPARPQIRLEAEKFGKKVVIHNYGHGGAGFTLSWGCAQNVVDIAEEL
ncbi:MAG TPA: FAD-dependent oxidoreductase [Patescibacteria group bacterium]